MNFHIISCGYFPSEHPYKAHDLVQKCVQSVQKQTYGRWGMYVYFDGGSLRPDVAKDDRLIVSYNSGFGGNGRFGAARSRDAVIRSVIDSSCDPNDVLVFLDLDDALAEDTALSIVAHEYTEHPDCWLTYGSYRMLSGRPAKFTGPIDTTRPIRNQPWKTTHLKTCRLGLYRKLKPDDLLDAHKQWYMSATDVALMFALVEMAGYARCRYIPEQIYEYNDMNPMNCHRVDAELQKANEMYIRKRDQKKRLSGY